MNLFLNRYVKKLHFHRKRHTETCKIILLGFVLQTMILMHESIPRLDDWIWFIFNPTQKDPLQKKKIPSKKKDPLQNKNVRCMQKDPPRKKIQIKYIVLNYVQFPSV